MRIAKPRSLSSSLLIAAVLLFTTAAPAYADLTAFLGRTSTGTGRPAKGFAVGAGFLIVGFEFEYSSTNEELEVLSGPEFLAPELKTYMFNGLLQTPIPVARTQFYGTLGGGVYHESLSIDPDRDETSFATNIGGGAKITLAGPLRLRLDYRIFSLRGTPRHTTVQRFYAGVNLKF